MRQSPCGRNRRLRFGTHRNPSPGQPQIQPSMSHRVLRRGKQGKVRTSQEQVEAVGTGDNLLEASPTGDSFQGSQGRCCNDIYTHIHTRRTYTESVRIWQSSILRKTPSSERRRYRTMFEKAAKKHSKPLMCAFNRRFDPGLRDIKQRVESGCIGKVQVVKTCSRDSPKPGIDYLKISGGIFHDCAVHDIDLICWLLGEYPESVSSFAHANFADVGSLDDHDTVLISLKFPSGTLAAIDLSRMAVYGYDQRVEVFGPKGMLSNGDVRPTGVKCYDGKGTTAVPICFSFASRYQESYLYEMEHFLDVVQGQVECEVKVESILAVYKIATACEEAARTGQIVRLEWN